MKRFIYAPTPLDLERAENLAKSIRLPIQIGESENTKDQEFDRSKVQIINVPSIKDIECHDVAHAQVSFYCDVINEWKNFLNSKCYLIIKNEKKEYIIEPRLKEINYIRFSPRVDCPGDYYLAIIVDDEIEFEKSIEII